MTKYYANEEGEVFSQYRKLKLGLSSSGYLLFSQGRGKSTMVHRFVAEQFIPNPNNLPEVNHINGVKTDNRVKNLEWVDRKTNAKHSCDSGLQPVGENSHLSKLSNSDVGMIKLMLLAGFSQTEIAKEFFVHKSTIGKIKTNKTWRRH